MVKEEQWSYQVPELEADVTTIGIGIDGKTIVKQRLCCSGMRWKEAGAAVVLSLRTLSHSIGHWEQFWSKLDQYGFPVAA